MTSTDPPIERVLFVAPNVHVYRIPPLTSTKGFNASSWTSATQPTAQQIFTARLRILETSIGSSITARILLEDPNTGELFAGAPYTSVTVVQQAQDSSRFFAVRVVGEGGMKATLGIGFEDRSPAFDFSIALGEVRKVLGFESSSSAGGGAAAAKGLQGKPEADSKKDFSLKEGEKITIQVGGKGRRHVTGLSDAQHDKQEDGAALFSIAPPPSAARGPTDFPQSSTESTVDGKSAQDLGFDDGEFGEFQ